MDKRREGESLCDWEFRMFRDDMFDSRKAWCRKEKNRSCNLGECQETHCELNPRHQQSCEFTLN